MSFFFSLSIVILQASLKSLQKNGVFRTLACTTMINNIVNSHCLRKLTFIDYHAIC